MIKELSHIAILVTDQDEALEFYTEKLGFKIRVDAETDGFRWLTVSPPGQPNLELVLMKPSPSQMVDSETVEQMLSLVKKGAMGVGSFQTDDCLGTYEELKAKGVEFIAPPKERPYGTEAIMKDNSGNWFSLTELK